MKKHIIKPRRLEKGDTIGIVAPACSFDKTKFKKGVSYLENLGFKIKYDLMIFKKYWGFAGYDNHRARQINRMFADKEIRAIFCAQAGYGSIRTIPGLDKRIIKSNLKIFVGYSDITVLLSYLYTVAGLVVFHGPVVSGEIHDKMSLKTRDYLLKAICSGEPLGEIKFHGIKSLKSGRASGVIVGGNLSLFISTIGTPYEIDTRGKIVFFEDVGEDLEVIDRYLMHLKLAGKFKNIKGMVFGKMQDCIDASGGKRTMAEVLADILKDVKVPIIYGFPSGHRSQGETNVTLPLGVNCTIDADRAAISIDESGVS
ncbi:MAG: LD-carboxypeptidase [Candidatus Omnitrophota bacterium]